MVLQLLLLMPLFPLMPLHASDGSLLTNMKQKESNLTHVLNVLFVYKEEANASGVPVTVPL